MDKDIDARFERVEKALEKMIESLAKNNPSDKLTEELVAAEAELAEGFRLLEVHQNNYARIVQLREETSQLDAQLKDILSSTWSMRNELQSVPITTTPQQPKYQFTAAELLSNAQHISRNTRPPPGVTNGVDMTPTPFPTQQEPDDSFRLQSQTQTPNTSFNLSFTNGVTTPLPVPNSSGAANAPTPTPNHPDTPTTTSQQPPSQLHAQPSQLSSSSTTATTLPTHLKAAVNPLHNAAFHPWPTQDKIRLGALAAVQRLSDRGIDPRGYDPEEAEARRKAEEQARKEAEERARQEREEAERRMREERERMARERERARQREFESRRESTIGGGGVAAPGQRRKEEQQPKQFTFLGGDDDDDDEDEDD